MVSVCMPSRWSSPARIVLWALLYSLLPLVAATGQEREEPPNLSAVAVVDTDAVVTAFPEISRSLAGYLALCTEYQQDIQTERRDLDEVRLELLDAKLSDNERTIERKQREVQDRTDNFLSLQRFWQRRLETARRALEEDPFFLRFLRAVEYVAIDGRFSLVYDAGSFSSALFSDNYLVAGTKSLFLFKADAIDITDPVIDRLRTAAR